MQRWRAGQHVGLAGQQVLFQFIQLAQETAHAHIGVDAFTDSGCRGRRGRLGFAPHTR